MTLKGSGSRELANRTGRAVFLCYHSIASEGPEYLTLPAELFERQLWQLGKRGFQSGDRQGLVDLLEGRLSQATAFLTFDDGFRDNHTEAQPLLRHYGHTAFLFVLPPLLDKGGEFAWPEMSEYRRRHPGLLRSVNWRMVEEMADSCFEIGSHTLSHSHLTELGDEALREELWESRRALKTRLGRCDMLAYPFGEADARVVRAARECGYRFAFTLPTATGQADADELTLPRVNVDRRDSDRRFAAKLSPLGRRVLLSPVAQRLRRLV